MAECAEPLTAASADVVIELSTIVNGERAILRCLAPTSIWDGEMTLEQRAAYVLGLREYLGQKILQRLGVDMTMTPARYPWPSHLPFDAFLADCDLPVKLGSVYNVCFEPLNSNRQHGQDPEGTR